MNGNRQKKEDHAEKEPKLERERNQSSKENQKQQADSPSTSQNEQEKKYTEGLGIDMSYISFTYELRKTNAQKSEDTLCRWNMLV